jgi:transposase
MRPDPRPVYVGIDVARDRLVAHVRPLALDFAVDNDPAGRRRLVRDLKRHRPHRVVLEPTGGYERAAAKALRDADLPTYLVNPAKVRAFATSTIGLAKTDALDAAALAHFAQVCQPPEPILRDQDADRLAEHLAWRDRLVADRNSLANHAAHLTDPALRRRARSTLDTLDGEIDFVCGAMRKIVDGAPRLAALCRRLKTAPGIGDLSAFALIARLPELGRLDGKKIASLVGVAPHPWDSGRFKGRRIIQGGRFNLRRSLYMAALAAARSDGSLRDFSRRLKSNGKPPKVALMAVLRKLLCRLNAMVAHDQDWVDQPNQAA